MKTLFVGGHHNGERLDVSVNGTIPAFVKLNYSVGQEDYTLRVLPNNHLLFAPTSWSDDDALFALMQGYHGPHLLSEDKV